MGKFRSKLKGQTKGKRWPKGQSSSSNPESRKYRDLAKSRFFQENLGPSNLTSDALRRHDTISSFTSDPLPSDDTESDASTYKTIQTFASDWSECSNISFNKLLTGFTPNSALHKEMLAVLAAVTEVIKQNGGEETSTEYFAALMTTIEVTEPEMSLAAVLGLLRMVIRTVPRPVLRAQFASASRLFLELLKRDSQEENQLIAKEVLGLLVQLLKAQELAAWQETNMLQMLGTVLAFTCHTKAKVRRRAQSGIVAVLEASCFMLDEHPPALHPAASHVANFCIGQLDAGTSTLHTLGVLGAVIGRFPAASKRRAVERVLALLAAPGGDILVTTCALRVLHALCSTEHNVALPAPHAARLVTALMDLQPASVPEAWLTTFGASLTYLARQDRSTSIACLPRAFTTITALWLSNRPSVMTAVTHTLHTLLEDCVGSTATYSSPLDSVYSTLRGCLGYQYHAAWHLVLHVLATAFRVAPHDASANLVGPILEHLAELRDSYKFTYNNELEAAVGAAVKARGPELVLEVIKLRKNDGSVNMDRSWMLPVLKEHVQGSTLEYFTKEILPLGLSCERQASILQQHNDSIGAHSLSLLGVQCWSLLPSFCRHPTDVRQNFRHLAKILGSAITDRKDLRLFVMSALRKLIHNTKDSIEDKEELSRFAKNYLPILFNLYTTRPVGSDEEGQRLAALDTVKEYLQITPDDLKKQLYENAILSWRESQDAFTRECLLDLVRCLSIHQSTLTLNNLYTECIQPMLRADAPKKEQKKAYRLLEEICNSDFINCQDFVKTQRKQISGVVSRGLGAAPCSRAARLRVQKALLRATPQLSHESRLLRSILPEAVMCLIEPSAKARQGAKTLLLVAAEMLEPRGELPQFVGLLLVGLNGTQELVRATVTALALVTEFHASALGQDTNKLLVDTMVKLSMLEMRDVVSACLIYFKIYISVVPTPIIAQNIPDIMKAITSMTSDCSNHFRLRVRDILDKLLRKFGSEAICSHVPTSDTTMLKRLKNLRKIHERKKRRKNLEDHEEDVQGEEEFGVRATSSTMRDILADSDTDDENDKESKVTKKQKTWIQEDAEDIIDFTEPMFAGRITSKRPGANSSIANTQKAGRGFKTSSDGRLIIQDLDDDSTDSKSDFEESDAASEAETVKMGPAKRKRTDTESVASTVPAKMKYKAGGSGIHRNLNLDPYTYLPLQRKLLNKRKRPGDKAPFKKLLHNKKRTK